MLGSSVKILASNVDQTAFPIVWDHHEGYLYYPKAKILPVPVPLMSNKLPGKSARGRSGGEDHRVLGVGAPLKEEISCEATFHVGHRGQHHLRDDQIMERHHQIRSFISIFRCSPLG